jgi:hypothetical protein
MAQNVHRWLLEREHFAWAQEHVPERKWYQIVKYFPGYDLRRQMVYVDAATGGVVAAQGGEVVPEGHVFLYGYDVQNIVGIAVPGLEDAMTAKPASRLEARGTTGDPKAPKADP